MTGGMMFKGTPGNYEAIGRVIRKKPKQTKTEKGTSFSLGFPVCEVTEYLDEEGAKTVANLMNLGEASTDLLEALISVRAALIRLAWDENTLMIEGIDAAIAKALGEQK